MDDLIRYSVIAEKNPREIVLLRGTGCRWRRCRFCDYHLDFSRDTAENAALNRAVLAQVTGQFGRLEVINSGSFSDLDADTMDEIERICVDKHISTLHFECHWRDRDAICALRSRFAARGVTVRIKIGVESFDAEYRERVLVKGIDERDPARIAALFDECCLIAGLQGQTAQSMTRDIEIGLAHFDRVCVNLMTPNTAPLQPDVAVCACFVREVAPRWAHEARVDLLLHNTDFGVGGSAHA